jgi:hypothetical protein
VGSLLGRHVVTDPTGREWTVGLRWLPRRPKWIGWGRAPRRSRRDGDRTGWFHGLEVLDAADSPGAFVAILGVVALVLVIWFAVIPIAVLLLDIVFVALLVVGGVAARVLFRRPWIVEARSGAEHVRWPVVGFGASRASVREAAEALAAGRPAATLGGSP